MRRVYVIEGDGRLKIGVSFTPHLRVLRVRGALRVIYEAEPHPDAYKVEQMAHRLLALDGKHIEGEWFAVSLDEAIAAIARAERIIDGHEPAPVEPERPRPALVSVMVTPEMMLALDDLRVLMGGRIPSRGEAIRRAILSERDRLRTRQHGTGVNSG